MDYFKKYLKKIAHYQVHHPFIILTLLVLLTIAISTGTPYVKTVASLEQMMPTSTEEIEAFHTLRDNTLGQDAIAIIISLDRNSQDPLAIQDIRDPIIQSYINTIHQEIESLTDIVSVQSIKNMPNEDMINSDFSRTIIVAMSDVGANDKRMNQLATKITDLTRENPPPPSTIIEFSGTPIIQQKLGELIATDRNSTQWISTILVFTITMLIFSSITSAIVPILVVTASVTWLYGTMGYTNLPISTLAGGVAAMVIGIGIDFAIHIMNKFKFERKKGLNKEDALESAVVETGTALIATSLTTTSAFLAFLFGAMPEMGRFGMLMAIGIGYSLIFSLMGLPALLIIEEKIIYFFKDKVHFGIEGEFSLKGGKK